MAATTSKDNLKNMLAQKFMTPPLDPKKPVKEEPESDQNDGGQSVKAGDTGAKEPKAPKQPKKPSTRKPKVKTKPKAAKTTQKEAGAVKRKESVAAQKGAAESVGRDIKASVHLIIPQSLKDRLAFYADNHAIGRKSSVNQIINDAIEEKLTMLEKKAGIRK